MDELLELDIGPVAHGGWCVARHDGRVVFVRHTLPGERVRARVTEETKRFLRADAIEILEASPDRVPAPCPFSGPGRCGGCDWQHVAVPAQRRLKATVLEEQLARIAGIERSVTVEAVATPRVVGAEPDSGEVSEGLGWRTRVQFAVRGDGAVGLRRHRSHQIEPIDACLIAHPQVEVLGIERKRWSGAAGVQAIVSAATGDRLAIVSTRGGRDRRTVRVPRLDAPVRVLSGPQYRERPDRPVPYVREVVAGRTWRVSGDGFWQVHPGAAQALVDAVLAMGEPKPAETAVDLYCGAGLFAGVLAEAVGPDGLVVGVESDAQAVRDARFNLRDLPQVTVEQGEVAGALERFPLDRADLVVLDPPRAGVGREVVERVAALTGRRVVYVSCDPATLARDLGYFAEHGWRLDGLRAFDVFPMTHHVEAVASLVRA